MRNYAITKADGQLIIMAILNDNSVEDEIAKMWIPDTENGETVDDFTLEKAGVSSYREIDQSEVPTDRTFREAWIDVGSIEVDLPKARDIHMDAIRAVRNQKLQALDIEQLKGLDVASEKQILRDLPQTFDLTQASTPEELKALWPQELA